MERIRELTKRIEEEGSRTTVLSIRRFLLGSGFAAPLDKKDSEIVLLTGCYIPYSNVEGFLSLVKLLKHFEVTFTFLEKEYCCSEPLLMKAKTNEEKNASQELAIKFVNRNIAQAEKLGARRIISVCLGCASMLKQYADTSSNLDFLYYPELLYQLKPKMRYEGQKKIGYFTPCMRHHLQVAPKAKGINLSAALRLLESIEGLEFTPLKEKCCVDNAYDVINESKKEGIQRVVTQCFGCQAYLQGNSLGLKGPQITTLPEFIKETIVR